MINKNYSSRTKTIINQVILNFLYKGGSILINLLFVPISIRFLGANQYGVWLTLYSFLVFFNFFDFGLGHGLRNHLTKQLANKNFNLAKQYVSTAYFYITLIALFSILIFHLLFDFINWKQILNITESDLPSVLILLKIVFVGFFINLSLKLINVIFLASLKPSLTGLLTFFNNFLSVILIYLFLLNETKSLIIYGSVIIGTQILVSVTATIYFFCTAFKHIIPSIKSIKNNLAIDIFGLGGKFFLLQIAAWILYSTDNIIITQLYTPADVTTYNIAHKFFGIFTLAATIILGPLWSAITDAQELNDIEWIKNTIQRSIKIILILAIFVILCYIVSDWVYIIWVGKEIIVPKLLSFCMALYVITSMLLQIFSMFLNGIGKIKIQIYVAIFIALINIPLSVFLAKYLGFGLAGIISATLICNLISLSFLPIQYLKIINNKAEGIWNE